MSTIEIRITDWSGVGHLGGNRHQPNNAAHGAGTRHGRAGMMAYEKVCGWRVEPS